MRKLTLLLATGFGLGLSPVAPGTVGSLLGVLFVVGLRAPGALYQTLFAVLLSLAAIVICDIAEKHFGNKDDRRIVADEYMTFPLCVIGLPWESAPWILVFAFLTHRFFDIIKPFPAWRLQKLQGGRGIVIDDVVSSLYALAANHLAYRLFHAYLGPHLMS